jgi:hypothetical protein
MATANPVERAVPPASLPSPPFPAIVPLLIIVTVSPVAKLPTVNPGVPTDVEYTLTPAFIVKVISDLPAA